MSAQLSGALVDEASCGCGHSRVHHAIGIDDGPCLAAVTAGSVCPCASYAPRSPVAGAQDDTRAE
jgi:hypothetical protein